MMNAADAVALLDDKETILYQSPSVERILGQRPEQLEGKCLSAKAGLYLPYYKSAKKLIRQHRPSVCFKWIPREQNTEADALSKQALMEKGAAMKIQKVVQPLSDWEGDARQHLAVQHSLKFYKAPLGCGIISKRLG
jgi:PAS domain S-box-containing protein